MPRWTQFSGDELGFWLNKLRTGSKFLGSASVQELVCWKGDRFQCPEQITTKQLFDKTTLDENIHKIDQKFSSR